MRAQGVDQQIVDMIEAASRHVGTGDFEGDRRHDQARSRMCTAQAEPKSGIPPTIWARPSRAPSTCLAPASPRRWRSEEHTSELQSLMRISYAVFCLKKKTKYSAQRYAMYTYK